MPVQSKPTVVSIRLTEAELALALDTCRAIGHHPRTLSDAVRMVYFHSIGSTLDQTTPSDRALRDLASLRSGRPTLGTSDYSGAPASAVPLKDFTPEERSALAKIIAMRETLSSEWITHLRDPTPRAAQLLVARYLDALRPPDLTPATCERVNEILARQNEEDAL